MLAYLIAITLFYALLQGSLYELFCKKRLYANLSMLLASYLGALALVFAYSYVTGGWGIAHLAVYMSMPFTFVAMKLGLNPVIELTLPMFEIMVVAIALFLLAVQFAMQHFMKYEKADIRCLLLSHGAGVVAMTLLLTILVGFGIFI